MAKKITLFFSVVAISLVIFIFYQLYRNGVYPVSELQGHLILSILNGLNIVFILPHVVRFFDKKKE